MAHFQKGYCIACLNKRESAIQKGDQNGCWSQRSKKGDQNEHPSGLPSWIDDSRPPIQACSTAIN